MTTTPSIQTVGHLVLRGTSLRRLPTLRVCRPWTSMFMGDDEELKRNRAMGLLAHQGIAALAGHAEAPTYAAITAVVDRSLRAYRPIEARAHRQNLAGAIGSYFWHLAPPPGWRFAGGEVNLGVGRVDLLWDHPGGVLLDEIKAGSPRQLRLPRTVEQVSRYLECGRSVWPDRFLGIRLLSLSDPDQSLFIDAAGASKPLRSTPYVTTRRT